MKCITGARYTMLATLLVQSDANVASGTNGSIVTEFDRNGVTTEREYRQDPITGEIVRVWDEAASDGTLATGDLGNPANYVNFKCYARGFTDGGLRLVGTDERFSTRGYVETIDNVTFKFPASIRLSRRDRITNIRDARSGVSFWNEEDGTPTIWEVGGVTPVMDINGKHIENSTTLRRAQVQGG